MLKGAETSIPGPARRVRKAVSVNFGMAATVDGATIPLSLAQNGDFQVKTEDGTRGVDLAQMHRAFPSGAPTQSTRNGSTCQHQSVLSAYR